MLLNEMGLRIYIISLILILFLQTPVFDFDEIRRITDATRARRVRLQEIIDLNNPFFAASGASGTYQTGSAH